MREKLKQIKGVDDEVVDELEESGYESILEISDEDADNLSDIDGISEKTSNKIENELPEAKLTDINGVGKTTAESLNQSGFESVSDIKSASIEELSDVEGIGETKAEKIKDDINENLEGRLTSEFMVTNDISVFSFKSTLGSLTTAIILTGLIWSGLLVEFDPLSMQELFNGNVSSVSFFSLQTFGFFIIAMTVGTGISNGIWYRLMTPKPVSSRVTNLTPFAILILGGIILGLGWGISYFDIAASHIGSIWVLTIGLGSIFLFIAGLLKRDGGTIGAGIIIFIIYAIGLEAGGWVADNYSLESLSFILAYTSMSLLLITLTSASFHEDGLDDYKEKKAESEKEYDKLKSKYNKLKSDAPESVNISLEIDSYKPNDETDPEEMLEQIKKAYERVKEIESEINSYYSIQESINNLEENTEELDNCMKNNEIGKSEELLRTIEAEIEDVENKTTTYEFSEFDNRLETIKNRLEDLVERFVQTLEKELKSLQSELQQAESYFDEDASEKADKQVKNIQSQDLLQTAKTVGEQYKSNHLKKKAEEIEEKREKLGQRIKKEQRETIENKINSLQSELDRVNSCVDNGDYKEAREVLTGIESKFRDVEQTVEEHEWTVLENKMINIEQRQQELLATIKREQERTELETKIDELRSDLNQAAALKEEKQFDEAQQLLTDLSTEIESAKDTAGEHELTSLEEDLTSLNRECIKHTEDVEELQNLLEEVQSLRGKLGHISKLVGQDDYETAKEELTILSERVNHLKKSASAHNASQLEHDVAKLEQRYKSLLDEVSEGLGSSIPDTIPRVSDMSIKYENVTDKQHIGSGGNADVYKATYESSDGGVTITLKEPRMSGTVHTDEVERMLNEAETWNRLDDHNHIVGVIDYGSEPLPWIAMEYMDGGHLGNYVEEDITQKLWIAYSVTEGVCHAHRRGVAHLDLKPENILFRNIDDAWDVPKVGDWGLSKHLLQHSKSVEGMTAEYAAPEQFAEEYGETDDITDVYQLGAVFYELFTGQPPFEGQPFKVIERIRNNEPTAPSEIADVPTELDDILLKALSKEKKDRYGHIVYLRDDLQDLFNER